MKTLKQVLSEYPQYSTLINAVIRRIGMESVNDVIQHGIGGGFHGFIYYTDTVKFWKTHRKLIMQMAKEMADDLGEDVMQMIGGFGCLQYYDYQKKRWTDSDGQKRIGETIYGGPTDDIVANAMAWFAAEEVCRMFDE